MPERLEPNPYEVESAGVTLAGEEVGEGAPVILLHGLTATRRYILHGSVALARAGRRLVSYDARGHGESATAPAGSYTYEALAGDLRTVVAERAPASRPVLVGHSMGCHTAVAHALDHADEVSALGAEGPVTLGLPATDEVLAG